MAWDKLNQAAQAGAALAGKVPYSDGAYSGGSLSTEKQQSVSDAVVNLSVSVEQLRSLAIELRSRLMGPSPEQTANQAQLAPSGLKGAIRYTDANILETCEVLQELYRYLLG